MQEGGFFVTYCAKGQLKRDLQTLGFLVEKLPKPPHKREMTQSILQNNKWKNKISSYFTWPFEIYHYIWKKFFWKNSQILLCKPLKNLKNFSKLAKI